MILTLSGQVDALVLSPSLEPLIKEIFDLLSIFESLFSRSSKDVFPFHLKHVELYRQLFKILPTVRSRLQSVKMLANYTDVDIQFLLDTLEGLGGLTYKIIDNSELSGLVNQLEHVFAVFQEVRRFLGQVKKRGSEVKKMVNSFLNTLKSDVSLGKTYKIVKKRFQMYEHELYVAYDNNYVPRTNNDLEDFNNCLKRPIRKGQGRRESWFYVEHQGVSATYYHNILNAPHVVGGADISCSSEKTPLERIGVLETISVTSIMNLIDTEYLYKSLVKNDKRYTVHRWTRKIFKHGLDTCLISLDSKWTSLMEIFKVKKKIIKGGKTSSS